MLKHKTFIAFTFFLIPLLIHAQPMQRDIDFSQVDSFARSIRFKNDVYNLTKELTSPYTDQLLQVRAIFVWITDNIGYDYKFINKEKELKFPECKPGEDCKQVRDEWEKVYIRKILKNKEAICDGYVRVFKKMCDIAGIKCDIIGGYTKTKPYQVGMAGSVHHAWNAVYIDSAWHLLDATWAAGGCAEDEETGKLLPFHKRFNNYYWFTPFHDFTRDHYPKEAKWVFEANYTKDKFADNPWYVGDILPKINLLSPASGVINAKKGDTLHFSFDYQETITHLQINSNVFRNPAIWHVEEVGKHKKVMVKDTFAIKRQVYIPFERTGNRYTFDCIVTDNSLYYLDILIDDRRAMRFNVKIKS